MHKVKKNHKQKRGAKAAIWISVLKWVWELLFEKREKGKQQKNNNKILGRKKERTQEIQIQFCSSFLLQLMYLYNLDAYKHKLIHKLFLECVQSSYAYSSGHIAMFGPITLALSKSIRTYTLEQ